MRKLKLLAFLFSAALVGGAYWLLPRLATPVEVLPLPYILKVDYSSQAQEAQKSNILIVGDQLGVKLGSWSDKIVRQTQEGLENPLKVYVWAEKGEGLHRTLAKIKSLKKMPEIIIYHGGSQEFFEKRLDPQFEQIMLKNFRRHQNKWFHSAMFLFPFLSQLIYQPYSRVVLSHEYHLLKQRPSARQRQKIKELGYLTYSAEYREFIRFLRERKASLIVVTPPHRLDLPPGKDCFDHFMKTQLKDELEEIARRVEGGKGKSAISRLQVLLKENVYHAQIYYLLGQALVQIGKYRDAKSFFYRARALDCQLAQGNMIFNRIQVQIAEKNEFEIVDFNRLVNSRYGREKLFQNDFFPQEIYYDRLISELVLRVKEILNLN